MMLFDVEKKVREGKRDRDRDRDRQTDRQRDRDRQTERERNMITVGDKYTKFTCLSNMVLYASGASGNS